MLLHRGTIPPDELWLAGLGTPTDVQFRQFTEDPDEIAAMVATYRAHYLEHHDRLVQPYPGVQEAVRALWASGVALGVVTSKHGAGAAQGLARCGLAEYFPVVVGADAVTRPKPDPEPVRIAVDRLGADPETTVFVGDSVHDLVSGRAAGVRTAAALWGPFPREVLAPHAPDHWLAHPGELNTLRDGASGAT
jgi:pyrophosphatase PpaX